MSQPKKLHLTWTGNNWDYNVTFPSGREVLMTAPGGSSEKGAGPMEFMLASVAGCTGVDMLSILQKMREDVQGVDVEITGVRADDYPMVYTDVHLAYTVTGHNVDEKSVQRAIELSMTKYCSASIIFKRAGVKVTTEYHIVETAPQ
ncbi:MAG TPA: OsmC family peroxiredoxin [Anaerolineae bacterium]|nr:OsmC family peroxiredoxin [Anaerolineae bacterium]